MQSPKLALMVLRCRSPHPFPVNPGRTLGFSPKRPFLGLRERRAIGRIARGPGAVNGENGRGPGDAAMRLGVLVLLAICVAGCSDSTPVAPASNTLSAEMVQKNCADPQWKDKNLGLWYSICRRPLNW